MLTSVGGDHDRSDTSILAHFLIFKKAYQSKWEPTLTVAKYFQIVFNQELASLQCPEALQNAIVALHIFSTFSCAEPLLSNAICKAYWVQ